MKFQNRPARAGYQNFAQKRAGFTMAEMVIILSIMTVISAIVLFSFTGLSERGSINRSARELALALRSAQGMSLAVTQVGVGSPTPVNKIPPAVGIKFVRGTNNYQIFADLNPAGSSRDRKYTDSSENIGDPKIMEKSVRINALNYRDPLGLARSAGSAHIIFTAPEATIEITDGNGAPLGNGEELEVELSPSAAASCEEAINPCKRIMIKTSGQINIK